MRLVPSIALFALVAVVASGVVVLLGSGESAAPADAAPAGVASDPDVRGLLDAAIADGRVAVSLTLGSVDGLRDAIGPAVIAEAVTVGPSVAVVIDVSPITASAALAPFEYRVTPSGAAFRARHVFGDDEFHVASGDAEAAALAADDLRGMVAVGADVRSALADAVAAGRWTIRGGRVEHDAEVPWSIVLGADSVAGAVVGGLLPSRAVADLTVWVDDEQSALGWTVRGDAVVAGESVQVTVAVEIAAIGGRHEVELPSGAPLDPADIDVGAGALLPVG